MYTKVRKFSFIVTLLSILGLALSLGDTNNPGRSHGATSASSVGFVQHPIDWTRIRTGKNLDVDWALIEGYLSFEGSGDFPAVHLWEAPDAMRQQRQFYRISVDAVSACTIINRRFGGGTENWRVLDGLFVEVRGRFKRSDEGARHLGLGRLSEVNRIDVYNNGRLLISIEEVSGTNEREARDGDAEVQKEGKDENRPKEAGVRPN